MVDYYCITCIRRIVHKNKEMNIPFVFTAVKTGERKNMGGETVGIFRMIHDIDRYIKTGEADGEEIDLIYGTYELIGIDPNSIEHRRLYSFAV